MTDFFNEIFFFFLRINWLSILDIALVTLVFFALLHFLRDTQAMVLLRGAIFLLVLMAIINMIVDLPAFSWLVTTTLPALIVAVPVIFAPEIRKALERIGRAGTFVPISNRKEEDQVKKSISMVVDAAARLSSRQHGALIIMQRFDNLDDFVNSGVRLNALVTPELLLQIFYPNTPLHDGAVIVDKMMIRAGSCVLPLSSSGILSTTPDRQMGTRHRAALGISEVSDAIAVVVSEETGSISIAHAGKMIRRLDPERLGNILNAFYNAERTGDGFFQQHFPYLFGGKE
jgi:diadenylate cyclase